MELAHLQIAAHISTIGASVAVLITTIFVSFQLFLQRKSVTTDDRRFIRESAQSVFAALQDSKFRDSRRIMLDVLRRSPPMPDNRTERDALRYVLNVYEMLGTKVRLEAISPEPWKIYWGRTTLRDWDRLKPFIVEERQQHSAALYTDAEGTIDKWRPSFETT